jgi:His/Glu/Gln/Arg/opine family amino acid ABC transporter permease subunit
MSILVELLTKLEHYPHISLNSIIFIASGLLLTLKYTFVSVVLGSCLAVMIALAAYSKRNALNKFNRIYISIFRGTPILIQLCIVYYASPGLTGYRISAFEAGVIAFSLNSAAYIAEIIRSGINAVDKGQFEAAKTLNISYYLMMRDIILPQAIKTILPALVNELTAMLKETAIVSVIGEADLMRRSQIVAAESYIFFQPLMIAALCYYITVMVLTSLAKLLEQRLKNDYH